MTWRTRPSPAPARCQGGLGTGGTGWRRRLRSRLALPDQAGAGGADFEGDWSGKGLLRDLGQGRLTDAPVNLIEQVERDGARRRCSRPVHLLDQVDRSARLKRPSLRGVASQTPGRRNTARGAGHRARPSPPGPNRGRRRPTSRSGPEPFTEPGSPLVDRRTTVFAANGPQVDFQAPRTTAPGARVRASATAAERRSKTVSARRLPRQHPAAPASPGQQKTRSIFPLQRGAPVLWLVSSP
jgi:hypothetical protein